MFRAITHILFWGYAAMVAPFTLLFLMSLVVVIPLVWLFNKVRK